MVVPKPFHITSLFWIVVSHGRTYKNLSYLARTVDYCCPRYQSTPQSCQSRTLAPGPKEVQVHDAFWAYARCRAR